MDRPGLGVAGQRPGHAAAGRGMRVGLARLIMPGMSGPVIAGAELKRNEPCADGLAGQVEGMAGRIAYVTESLARGKHPPTQSRADAGIVESGARQR